MITLPLGLLCPILGLGLFIFILVKLIRPNRRRWSPLVQPPVPVDMVTSMADDGFWVSSDRLNPSTMIQYFYWVHGVEQMGQVPFEPGPDGRQFIYTGVRPDSLSVVLADEAQESDLPDANTPPLISTPPPVPRESSWSRPTHFPRAY